MIELLSGRVSKVETRGIVVNVDGGIGFYVYVSSPAKFALGSQVKLLIYFNWSSENGPSLFGFETELERLLFVSLLECPKIGPQAALQVLAGKNVVQVLRMLASGDERALSSLSGIGPKRARGMVLQLREKAADLLSGFNVDNDEGRGSVSEKVLDEVLAALKAMGYSSKEISAALSQLSEDQIKRAGDFPALTRLMLSVLLKQRSK